MNELVCFRNIPVYKHYERLSMFRIREAGKLQIIKFPNLQITEERKFEFNGTHTKNIYLLHVQAWSTGFELKSIPYMVYIFS